MSSRYLEGAKDPTCFFGLQCPLLDRVNRSWWEQNTRVQGRGKEALA